MGNKKGRAHRSTSQGRQKECGRVTPLRRIPRFRSIPTRRTRRSRRGRRWSRSGRTGERVNPWGVGLKSRGRCCEIARPRKKSGLPQESILGHPESHFQEEEVGEASRNSKYRVDPPVPRTPPFPMSSYPGTQRMATCPASHSTVGNPPRCRSAAL